MPVVLRCHAHEFDIPTLASMAAVDHSYSLEHPGIMGWGTQVDSGGKKMSIFGHIVSAIFKHGTAAATAATAGSSALATKGELFMEHQR
jgi:hypothetical protein